MPPKTEEQYQRILEHLIPYEKLQNLVKQSLFPLKKYQLIFESLLEQLKDSIVTFNVIPHDLWQSYKNEPALFGNPHAQINQKYAEYCNDIFMPFLETIFSTISNRNTQEYEEQNKKNLIERYVPVYIAFYIVAIQKNKGALLEEIGLSPLHIFSMLGKIDAVNFLINWGVLTELPTANKNFNGILPIQCAAYGGHLDVIQALLEASDNSFDYFSCLKELLLYSHVSIETRKEIASFLTQYFLNYLETCTLDKDFQEITKKNLSYLMEDVIHSQLAIEEILSGIACPLILSLLKNSPLSEATEDLSQIIMYWIIDNDFSPSETPQPFDTQPLYNLYSELFKFLHGSEDNFIKARHLCDVIEEAIKSIKVGVILPQTTHKNILINQIKKEIIQTQIDKHSANFNVILFWTDIISSLLEAVFKRLVPNEKHSIPEISQELQTEEFVFPRPNI